MSETGDEMAVLLHCSFVLTERGMNSLTSITRLLHVSNFIILIKTMFSKENYALNIRWVKHAYPNYNQLSIVSQ